MVISKTKLLKIPEVINEVSRHLWFESEKAGYDVGRKYAEDDWYNKYSKEWIRYNLPQEAKKVKEAPKPKAEQVKKKPVLAKAKKRRAKSYTA